MIYQIKKIVKGIVFKFIKVNPTLKYNSYSQAGEDMILNFLFQTMQLKDISYIDIGANKPDFGNNTYKFYLEGYKGISIEPDYELYCKFRDMRPRDISLNIAIGFDHTKQADLYVFNEPSLNTLSKEEAERRDAIGEYKIVNVVPVKVMLLAEIIDRYCTKLPTYISLDVEGIDFEILKTLDFKKYPVPVLIVETIEYSINHIKTKIHDIIIYMKESGYFVYADTYVNTIFVHQSWFLNYNG